MTRTMALALTLTLAACGGNSPANASAPGASSATAKATSAATADTVDGDQVVATWNGGQLTYAEVDEKVSPQLASMEIEYLTNRYNTQSQALEMLVMEKLLETEAERQGLDGVEALLAVEIEAKVTPPTDEEVEAFYPMVARNLRGMPKEDALPLVAQELTRRRQGERYMSYVDELKAQAGVEMTLPFPDLPRIDVPILEHDPVRGSDEASVTIVQFAEYQCGFCQKAMPTIDAVFERYPGQVRMVFKDFPLDFHAKARGAAVAAHCAGEQDKYWEMHHELMTHQQTLERPDLIGFAKQLELDETGFTECLDSGRYDEAIDADMEAGRLAGVSGTPAFFVNGVMLSGAQGFDKFEAIIERELNN